MLGLGNTLAGGSPSEEPFTPANIDNLALWLKNGTGLTGDPVSQWDDQSGNGNYVVQSSSGNQGDLDEGGIHLEEDNSDHYDLKDSSDSLLRITMSANHNFLIGFVIKMESHDTQNCLLSDNNNEFIDFYGNQKLRVNCTGTTTTHTTDSNTYTADTQLAIVISRNDGATGTFNYYINGVAVTASGGDHPGTWNAQTNPAAVEFSVLGARFGSGRFFDGTVYELVVYDLGTGTHTAGELTSLNNYLTTKFGL